jgi:hypothetical protein
VRELVGELRDIALLSLRGVGPVHQSRGADTPPVRAGEEAPLSFLWYNRSITRSNRELRTQRSQEREAKAVRPGT